ncbi:hypothetical protein K1Y28_00185 [Staphylococcus warneri]|jgi:hypothetical protein|uniref:Uncharacterized protein n=2 Tax=Staphylococcus warneri TaxID=1292 RepID=A0A2T4PYY4_STAWA|nr:MULTISPECIES: hypothetical protein [Staphylococcus]MBE9428073.1 hypothetical protein [Staphylococcus epidermidis]MBY6181267.1 hypothetical protein [Staphylococcaceae bacterium DP2N0-1]AXV42044.1 hypothetical protein Ssp1_10040 [Staphylococcus sp. M0911]EEQ78966.1 hypothetical protein STAWA0001_1470 [Staphylococcus warneri L37603]MCD8803066.1 hypothetical protein [Staphylococcus warneri]
MLGKYWKYLMIATVIVSLISIKAFPLALGALYLPVLFKIVQLQLNLSNGLIDEVSAQTFIKSNQSGIIISVICCLAITGILMYTLDDFYNSLTGILSILIKVSPFTIIISAILYILTAIATVQATKQKFQ